MFELVMIPGPLALAWLMDTRFIQKRRLRGLLGISIMGAITLGTYAGLTAFIHYDDIRRTKPPPAVDWNDSRFAAGLVLYLLTGIIYAGFQICGQWILGALTNDPALCARYAGLFKGTTSLGLMVCFIMDGQGVSYRTQQIVQFVLYAVGVASLSGVTWVFVQDTNYFEEADVIVPHHVEQAALRRGLVVQEDVDREREKEMLAQQGYGTNAKQGAAAAAAAVQTHLTTA